MSDLDLSRGANSNEDRNAGSPKNLKDQMAEAGATVKQRADEAFRATADIAQDKFKEAGDAAKDLASGTMDQIRGQAREQQRTGAEFIERLAGNVREAARAFESDVPFAARGINSAADYVEDTAEKIRNGSFRDLLDGATDFAKRLAPSRAMCLLPPAASTPPRTMLKIPPRRSATAASAISSMAQPISRSVSQPLSLASRCSPVSPPSAS